MFCTDFSAFAYEILLVQHPKAFQTRGRERGRKREREKGPGFTSRCKWSPCSSNYSGSWSEQTHWERDSAPSATGTVSKSLLIALMNIGLAAKQEELISAVYAFIHTLPAAMIQVRATFGLLLIVWEVLQKNDYLTVVLLGRFVFQSEGRNYVIYKISK